MPNFGFNDKVDFSQIEGPVHFFYLKGDPGDGFERKIILFSDGINRYPLTTDKSKIAIADFFRNTASRLFPEVLDLFIEAPFQREYFDDKRIDVLVNPATGKIFLDNYMGDVIRSFSLALMQNKSYSKELMRVHYTNVENTSRHQTSLFNIKCLLGSIINNNPIEIRTWITAKWPESHLVNDEIFTLLDNSRLSDTKIQSLGNKVRIKFDEVITLPVISQVADFLLSKENEKEFNLIKFSAVKAVVLNKPITDSNLISRVESLWHRLSRNLDYLTSAYCICRMLKKSTRSQGARWEMSLEKGQPMTHMIGYHYYPVTSNIMQWLLQLGFHVVKSTEPDIVRRESCLDYSLISQHIEDFCSLKKVVKKKKKRVSK